MLLTVDEDFSHVAEFLVAAVHHGPLDLHAVIDAEFKRTGIHFVAVGANNDTAFVSGIGLAADGKGNHPGSKINTGHLKGGCGPLSLMVSRFGGELFCGNPVFHQNGTALFHQTNGGLADLLSLTVSRFQLDPFGQFLD